MAELHYPAPVLNTPVVISHNQINLSWGDDIQYGGYGVFGIYRSTDGTNWTQAGQVFFPNESYQDTGLTPGTQYWYKVSIPTEEYQPCISNTVTATTQQLYLNLDHNQVVFKLDGTPYGIFSPTFNISANTGNNWTATREDTSWLSVSGAHTKSGSGNGNFIITCQPSASNRSAEVLVNSLSAQKIVNVTQHS